MPDFTQNTLKTKQIAIEPVSKSDNHMKMRHSGKMQQNLVNISTIHCHIYIVNTPKYAQFLDADTSLGIIELSLGPV